MKSSKRGTVKDWWTESNSGKKIKFEPRPIEAAVDDVLRIDQMPELLTAKEAAVKLRIHFKTAYEMMSDGRLGSVLIGRRRFTTPGLIALFVQNGTRKHG